MAKYKIDKDGFVEVVKTDDELWAEEEKRRVAGEEQLRAYRRRTEEQERLRCEQERLRREQENTTKIKAEAGQRLLQAAKLIPAVSTSQDGFIERCKKYGLSQDCELEDIERTRNEYATAFAPDREQIAEDRAVAHEMLSELNADCNYLIFYLSTQESKIFLKEQEIVRIAELERTKREAERQARARKFSDKEYHRSLSKSLLSNPAIVDLHEEYLLWCFQEQPSEYEARNAWHDKLQPFLDQASELREREQKKVALQADLTRLRAELDALKEHPHPQIDMSSAVTTLAELKAEKNSLGKFVDADMQLQIIKVRCCILEEQCVSTRTEANRLLLLAYQKRSAHPNKEPDTSGGAKVGAAVGGFLGLLGGVPGVLFGAALGGAIGAGLSNVDVDRLSINTEIDSKNAEVKRWLNMTAEVIMFRGTFDAL